MKRPEQIRITKWGSHAKIQATFGLCDVRTSFVKVDRWRQYLENRGWASVPRVWGPTT